MAVLCHGWRQWLGHLTPSSLCSSQALEEREQAQGEKKWEAVVGTGDPTSCLDWAALAGFDPLAVPRHRHSFCSDEDADPAERREDKLKFYLVTSLVVLGWMGKPMGVKRGGC